MFEVPLYWYVGYWYGIRVPVEYRTAEPNPGTYNYLGFPWLVTTLDGFKDGPLVPLGPQPRG